MKSINESIEKENPMVASDLSINIETDSVIADAMVKCGTKNKQ
jgi:hypothetical protein